MMEKTKPSDMLIDTHAHIYLDRFADDIDEVLDRAHAAGVERIVMPAIDVASIRQAIGLCERREGLFAMAALHPSETKEATEADFEAVAELCNHPCVVAVGETGLDYYWDRSFDDRQQRFLRRHIDLAVEKDLPIVFHNREAFDDLIEIVEEARAGLESPDRLRGIFHCFTGTSAEAGRVHRAGFLIGLGGILTFKNAQVDESVKDVPIEWTVLETDAPYLAPEPHRGRRNEPAFVRHVAEKLAEVKGLSVDDVARTTTATAEKLFGLDALA